MTTSKSPTPDSRPPTPIVLLTDFGHTDAYVAAMKGVILIRNPAARLVDLTHDVPPQDIARAAFLLATTVPYFAPGTIFLTVVDPGVGTDRRALVVHAAGWYLVGPDNGVLAWALHFLARDNRLALDVVAGHLRPRAHLHAVELTEPRFWRPQVSSTFHGRDIFAPVAAELSLGRPLDHLGRPAPVLLDLPWPEPRRLPDGTLEAQVVTLDRYGNLITNLRPEHLPPSPTFEIAGHHIPGLSLHFQSDRPLLALIGSSGFVEVAAPNASAAALLHAAPGTPIRGIRRST